jgi:uncharacterized membrane protein YedE/YeeE
MKKSGMNPYLAGSLSGLLLVVTVYVTGNFFGASTSYVRNAAMLKAEVAPIVEHNSPIAVEYYDIYIPIIDWQWMFVTGVIIGGFLTAMAFREFKLQALPRRWRDRFGSSISKRAIIAFIGGVIAMFGARMAGGCPSGHGLSGLSQLSLSGFVALCCFFVGGVVTAHILYRKRIF